MKLPKLPEAFHFDYDRTGRDFETWTVEQMIGYGRQCAIEALEAAAKECVSCQSKDKDWDTSYWNQAAEQCAFFVRKLKDQL